MSKTINLGAVSAYALAVKHGYTGTEAEWIAAVESARTSAETARDQSVSAKNQAVTAKEAALEAKTKAESAHSSAETAQALAENAKTAAQTAKTDAETAKADAVTAKTDAISAKTGAESAKADAISAKEDAVSAKEAAVTAQGKAEAAQSAAEASASSISASASQIATNTSAISSLKEDITDLGDRVSMLEEVSALDNFSDIAKVVRAGRASKYFNIGDQIIVPWSDGTTTYQMPFDVVHFGNVELENGTTVPGMYLESHYLTPFGVQFDANEAFYYCENALPAGTYYITAVNNWGKNIVSGESYQFTTTQEVPAGGQLALTQGACDTAFANWRVYSYANGAATQIETITPVKGTSGTKLGDWSSSTKYSTSGMNNMQRSNYGYNRWGQSGIRQWLNSDKGAGQWWASKNVFDRVPSECATKRGWLAGFGSDFLGAIKPVKIVTALNTVSDTEIGASEITYDRFFLASLEQDYCNPQAIGVEGDAWEYWKQTLPQKHNPGVIIPEHIRYGIDNKTTAQSCRLRSAYRGSSHSTCGVYSSGNLNYYAATNSLRCAPACVIC